MSFIRLNDEGLPIRKRSHIDCQKAIEDGEVIRVEQAHKQEVNINNIVRKHGADLIARVASLQTFEFDDVTGNDFQENMNALIQATKTFEQIPSDLRRRFDHEPAKFMDFITNPDNLDEMRTLGLAKQVPEPEPPVKVEVTNPSTSPATE